MLHRHHKQRFDIQERRRLTFYAAVFDEETTIHERDQGGQLVTYTEVIRPGAFSAALATDDEVIANLDHDPARTFARRSDGSLLLQEDPHGLFASAWVPEGEFGDSILADVLSGKLDGCSFRFGPVKSRTTNGVVERLQVTLADVCLTAFPAYDGTEVHVRNKALQRVNFLFTKLRLLKIKARQVG